MKFIISFIITVVYCCNLYAQFTIANGLPGCLPVVNQEGIACGGGTTFFGVNAMNQFQVQNIDGINCCAGPGGDSGSYFEFDVLNISDFMNINISLGYSASNTSFEDDSPGAPIFGCSGTIVDNSHDQIVFTYSINGGPEIQSLYVHGTSQANFTGTWMAGPLNGNTIKVKIYASNKATAEIFFFQNLLITGTPKLSAGPDDIVCYPEMADLNGVWTGTWSGGSGTIGNVNIPVTTYTPNASEQNSMVTLTYTGLPAYPGCPTPSDQMIVTVNPSQDATFDFPDFCVGSSNGPTNIIIPGGTFSFNPNPGDGATINPTTGVISNATGGTTYSVQYVTLGPCPGTEVVMVQALPNQNASFIFADFCIGDPNGPTNIATPGGTFSLNPNPGDGASINPATGVISNPVAGNTYSVEYITPGPCPNNLTLAVDVLDLVIPVFGPFGPYCTSDGIVNLPTTQSGITGNWSGPGVVGNQFNPTTAGAGMFQLTFTPDAGQCATVANVNIEVFANPVGSLTGSPTICWNLCDTVIINLSGGTGLYDVNLNFSGTSLNFDFSMNGIMDNTKLTICYGGFGFISFDPITNQLKVPFPSPSGLYVLSLVSFSSIPSGPCSEGIIDNPGIVIVTISENLIYPNDFHFPICDYDQDGIVTYDLTSLEDILTNGNMDITVNWYMDPGHNFPILDPTLYTFSGGHVFIIYTSTDGCGTSGGVVGDIQLPVIPQITDYNICINDPIINLPLIIDGIAGNWSGANVTNNVFDPTGLPAGNYPITFTPSGTICAATVTVEVIVSNAGPVPLPNPLTTSCIGYGFVFFSNSQGGVVGVWSGSPFLSGNSFNMTASGVGNFTITFTPTSGNTCFTPNTTDIIVTPNTSLTPFTFPDICAANGVFDLGSTIQGQVGVWSGNPQVNNNSFDPNTTPGTYPLLFTPNDPCFEPLMASIEVVASTILSSPTLGPTCTNGAPIVLPTTINSVTGTWTIGGLPITTFDPSIYGTGNFTLDFTVDAGFCASSFSTIISVSAITAGFDSLQMSCRSNTNIVVNLDTYLTPGTTPGGIWTYNGNSVADPTMVDLSLLPDGFNEYFYIINDVDCGQDTAIVSFDIEPENNAGNSTIQSLCSTNAASVNFASLLGVITSGGTWIQPMGVNVDLSNLMEVDLSNLLAGTYDFTYVLPENNCAADTSHTVFTIQTFNSAGTDVMSTLCLGATIDLSTLVNGGFTLGNFLNPNNIAGLTDSLWNTTGLTANTYVFQYEATNINPCISDTATLTLNLASVVTAGQDGISNYCQGSVISLNDYLSVGASLGGVFYNNGNIVPNGIFNTTGFNVLIFQYIVGDGVTCPRDTSFITLGRVSKPVLTIDPIVNICDGDCQRITINHNAAVGSNFSLALTSSAGQTYRNVVTVVNNNPLDITFCASLMGPFNFGNLPLNQTFTLRIDSLNIIDGGCRFDYIVTSTFNTQSTPTRNIIRTLCNGNTVTVGSDVYTESNPSGVTIIPSAIANSCDSIINVNLTFVGPSPITNLVETTCDQTFSITVGNTVFNSSNPFGQVTLQNANGCDSIVNVNLTYSSFSSGNFNFATCDANYAYTLAGQTFDINNTNGPVTLVGGSASGCDSIVNVSLTFLPPSSFDINETTCDATYFISYGNQTFNLANPSGSVTLFNQAQNGCDSIINVNLTFLPMAVGRNDIATCNDDYSFSFNGITYNKANPTGSYTLSGAAANGCDSLVNIQLNFSEFSFISELNYACDESDAVFNINLASHPGPYDVSINNVSQPTLPSLPFNTSFSPGSYFVEVETFDGCQDTITVVVDENNGPLVTLSQVPLLDGRTQINVNAPSNVLYDLNWTPSSTLTCSDCFDPIAFPIETSTYTLQYMYGDDCVDTRVITIERLNSEVIVPNIFSPNGDGINDQFYVQLPEGVTGLIKIMRVYDRWGNLMFDKKDIPANEPSAGWQGTLNGNFVVPGVFVYYLEVQIDGKPKVDKYSGDITVTR
jgi:gliding motility-associated-like protein